MNSSLTTAESKERIVEALRGLAPYVQNGPGEVFFSGQTTFKKGDYFIMGLNPGGGDVYHSVIETAGEVEPGRFSNYLDQCWQPECWNSTLRFDPAKTVCHHGNGTEKHQRGVQTIARRSGIKDLRDVFATQAIFLKSPNTKSFKSEYGVNMKHAFETCWPVHKVMLSIVQPKVIVCLGFQDDESSFAFLQTKASRIEPVRDGFKPDMKRRMYRWTRIKFHDASIPGEPLLVGVYHPSFRPKASDCDDFESLIKTEFATA